MKFVVLNEKRVAADTLTISVAGLGGQFFKKNSIGLIALGYSKVISLGRRYNRLETVGQGNLFGYFGIQNAGSGFLPDLLIFLSGKFEALVIRLNANGRIAIFRKIVINIFDDSLFAWREIPHIAEPGNNLVAFLKEWIIDKLQVAVGDGQLKNIQFLFIVGKGK